MNAPVFLADQMIAQCLTYRDAVRLAWSHRRIKGMTKETLAEECGLYASHVSDYLNPEDRHKDGRNRRSLPAEKIAVFEGKVGNKAITQFLTRQASLTLMEEVIAQRTTVAA